MASSMGWNGGPILFYHIYCMITSPKLETAEGCVKGEHGKVKGSRAWGTNGVFVRRTRAGRALDRSEVRLS